MLTFTGQNDKIVLKLLKITEGCILHGIKIAHISDMHLGSVFASLPYELSKMRSKELLYTCIKVIEDSADCDVLLLSGDIFDSGDISLLIIDQFLSVIGELNKTQVFFSCGNHDSYYTNAIKYCVKNAPDNLHIFSPDKITHFTLESIKTRVYGVSFLAEHQYDSLISTMPECSDDYINILCMHGDMQSLQYNPFNVQDFDKYKLDYVALGHIHKFSGIKNIGSCHYAYSGIVEGRGFDECGTKGYIKGTLYKKNHNLQFISCASREYVDEHIDITDFKNEYDLVDVVKTLGSSRKNICRFNLVGANNFGKQIDTLFIKNACDYFFCELTDNTKTCITIDEYCDYPGLLGACANETKKRINEAQNDADIEKYKKAFEQIKNIFENR